MKPIRYYIDKAELLEDTAHLTGWALAMDGSPLDITVKEKSGAAVDTTVRSLSRPDACRAVFGDDRNPDCGFDVKFVCRMDQVYQLFFCCELGTQTVTVNPRQLAKETERRYVPFSRMVRMTTPSMVGDDLKYLLKSGPIAWKNRLKRRYETDENKYLRWLEAHRKEGYEDMKSPGFIPAAAGRAGLSEDGQGSRSAAEESDWSKRFPTVSIVVPLYNTPVKFYREMLQSVQAQTYENWQLCLADGSNDAVDRGKLLPEDSRISYRKLIENQGISGNTNAALAMAEGQWIALLDHDDILEPTALAEMVERAEAAKADMIYSDEDKVSLDLRHYYEPHFKSDYNPDLLRSNNYICHFLMVKSSLVEKTGGLRPAFDGAQDYDFILRLSEQAEKIEHLPRVLYHWRTHPASTAENPESKQYAYEAGRRAIEEHLSRAGIRGTVEMTERPGYYRVRYLTESRPLISIIIPNKDESRTLRTCIESILSKTDWPEYEIIVVENNSTTGEIREYYQEIQEDPRIRVVTWPDEFNYSAINNFGVAYSHGEYIVLLNNDTEVISPNWLTEMAGIASRPEVGIVGAHLFYPDGTVQHAGVVMKLAGCCGHVFYGAEAENPGSYARAWLIQDYSAVTAACLMCKRSLWEELQGLSTDFQVAYNDVDFCLRARAAGYLVVYTPYAKLYHYESKTRGYEEGSEKQARFLREQKLLKERFPSYQEKGDPYYNPNLTLVAPDFTGRYLHDGQ